MPVDTESLDWPSIPALCRVYSNNVEELVMAVAMHGQSESDNHDGELQEENEVCSPSDGQTAARIFKARDYVQMPRRNFSLIIQ